MRKLRAGLYVTLDGVVDAPEAWVMPDDESDVSEAVSRLKQEDGETITLNGSVPLLRTLLRAELVDEWRLWLHPVVRGSGHRLFDNGLDLGALELADRPSADAAVRPLEPTTTPKGDRK